MTNIFCLKRRPTLSNFTVDSTLNWTRRLIQNMPWAAVASDISFAYTTTVCVVNINCVLNVRVLSNRIDYI